jgi:hypothetical protein
LNLFRLSNVLVVVCLTSEVDSVNEKQNRAGQEGTTEASNIQGSKKIILLKYTRSVTLSHYGFGGVSVGTAL